MDNLAMANATIDTRKCAFRQQIGQKLRREFGTIVLDVQKVTLLADYFVISGGETKFRYEQLPTQLRKVSMNGHET